LLGMTFIFEWNYAVLERIY